MRSRSARASNHGAPRIRGDKHVPSDTIRNDIRTLLAAGATSVRGLTRLATDKSSRPHVRNLACWALGHLGAEGSMRALTNALREDTDKTIPFTAAHALIELRPPRLARALTTALVKGKHASNREAAAMALGEIRARDGVGPLLNIVRDSVETPSVRGRAAEALGSIRDPRAIGPLIECLRQSPPSVRFWSVFALGKIGDPRALPHLRALTSDDTVVPNWWSIGKEARDAIRRIRSVAGHE